MSVRSDLADFLESDLVSAFASIDAAEVYQGQDRRNKPTKLDVRIRHRARENLSSKVGKLRRHAFEVVLEDANNDKEREQARSAVLLDLAADIVDRYDGPTGGLAILRAGLTSLTFERVRCRADNEVRVAKDRQSRGLAVSLAIDVWED